MKPKAYQKLLRERAGLINLKEQFETLVGSYTKKELLERPEDKQQIENITFQINQINSVIHIAETRNPKLKNPR